MPERSGSNRSPTNRWLLRRWDMGRCLTSYWPFVLLAWIVTAGTLRIVAPAWEEIAADGDIVFLPATVPSAIGRRALEDAFPGTQTRSQLIIAFGNESEDLRTGDLAFALDVARRMHWMAATSAWKEILRDGWWSPNALQAEESSESDSSARGRGLVLLDMVDDNLTQVIEIEESLSKFFAKTAPETRWERLPGVHALRGRLREAQGRTEEAAVDLEMDRILSEQGAANALELPAWSETVGDIWSWRSPIVGHKLGSDNARARLIQVHLATEVTATQNIDVLNGIEEMLRGLRQEHQSRLSSGLRAEVSGSAAVGADMLRAAASGVNKTEITTVILVLLILITVYRAPLLVAIPLVSIALSLMVAVSVIAILARDPNHPAGTGLYVFTTTRIFIVVLLFGTGTDFCLFFLARNREQLRGRSHLNGRQMRRIIGSSWRSVKGALIASAFTTIVGLGLMWFSRFQKYQFSGPIIAISLAITLLVCLTFTPALLCGLGTAAFWPLLKNGKSAAGNNRTQPEREGRVTRYWGALATRIVRRPGAALTMTVLALLLPSVYGAFCLDSVTYDLTEELSQNAPSRRGARLISRFFPVNDASPVSIMITREKEFESVKELQVAVDSLTPLMYVQGVHVVRSLTDPLGDYPPGKRMGLFAQDAWRRRLLQNHRITQERYLSSVGALQRRVARFEVLLDDNPFSYAASQTVARLQRILEQEADRPTSPWSGAQLAFSGTTVGVTDLRLVTQSDQRRIQVLVTFGVWLVLIVMLRKLVLSTYLVFTVLLSYFATLGITYFTFASLYGAEYSGLDWKVPLFLFVILVAVGQDYNVYLVMRIFEENRSLPTPQAVHLALRQTGGIITSCGFVMAGTFIAMTSPAILQWAGERLPAAWMEIAMVSRWFDTESPVLRGITELGFALSFGVLLDTLVVRTILVPSFVILWCRDKSATQRMN